MKNKNSYYADLHAAERKALLSYLNENMASTFLVNFPLPLSGITGIQAIIKGNDIVINKNELTFEAS